MNSRGATLFIVGADPLAGDPLDAVASAEPILQSAYQRVVRISPSGDRSLRAMRRAFRPERDRLLYDFTRREPVVWAGREPETSPGLILVGAARLTLSSTPSRAGLRYAELAPDAWRTSQVVALAANVGGLPVLPRPAPRYVRRAVSVKYDITCVCPEFGVAEAYAALLVCREHFGSVGRRMLIVAQDTKDAEEITRYSKMLGVENVCDVQTILRRRELFILLAESRLVCEFDRRAWPGVTDVVATAMCVGRPVMRLEGQLSDASEQIAQFWKSGEAPGSVNSVPTIEPASFGKKLVRQIEVARRAISVSQGWAA
ncbi:MAG: hypothetical protein ACPGGK_12945 [Pikeienuella sp.]